MFLMSEVPLYVALTVLQVPYLDLNVVYPRPESGLDCLICATQSDRDCLVYGRECLNMVVTVLYAAQHAERLYTAERVAKERRLRIWKDYVAPVRSAAASATAAEFQGKVPPVDYEGCPPHRFWGIT